MNKNLTCNQVSALINFYMEGKLNPRLKEYVDIHLSKCPNCRKKFQELEKILKKYKVSSVNNETQNEYKIDPAFVHKLSAYVDNELNTDENIKIKKMTISNPSARKELETMYKFQKIMHSAFEKTKNDSKFDYSKQVLTKIQEPVDYTTNYFYKLAIVFIILITAIISGFIYLYF